MLWSNFWWRNDMKNTLQAAIAAPRIIEGAVEANFAVIMD
jgi:hypothetical protein